MPWTLVRLELAPTAEFPQGSAARGFCLRVPLGQDGHIEVDTHARTPLRATARRFWPSEPDLTGYVVRNRNQWQLQWRNAVAATALEFSFGDCAFIHNAVLEIFGSDRSATPFLVKKVYRG